MKKNKASNNPNLSHLFQKLQSDFESWDEIPTGIKKKSAQQKREELYTELKEKIKKLSEE
ncbi:MAG: hypothetical protein KDD34_07970 [Bdellovibrionales bacterium]|nr:hypothetical protein [Bdellovibrionales bacterium]